MVLGLVLCTELVLEPACPIALVPVSVPACAEVLPEMLPAVLFCCSALDAADAPLAPPTDSEPGALLALAPPGRTSSFSRTPFTP